MALEAAAVEGLWPSFGVVGGRVLLTHFIIWASQGPGGSGRVHRDAEESSRLTDSLGFCCCFFFF